MKNTVIILVMVLIFLGIGYYIWKKKAYDPKSESLPDTNPIQGVNAMMPISTPSPTPAAGTGPAVVTNTTELQQPDRPGTQVQNPWLTPSGTIRPLFG